MASHHVTSYDNAALARNVLAALNAHDLDRFEGYLTPDFRCEIPGVNGAVDRQQTRTMMETGLTAFPDDHFDIQRVIADGDDVAIEWIWNATHLGSLRDPTGPEIAATGRKVHMRGSTLLRFRDGKVAEERDFFDPNEIMQQITAAPGSEQTSLAASGSTMRGLVHLEIPAADRKSAAIFYGEMFGWESEHMPEEWRYTTFKTGNVGGGFPDVSEGYQPGDVTFYVGSGDIDADLRHAEALGGKTLVPRTEIPGMGWFAILADPTGNRVGLFST